MRIIFLLASGLLLGTSVAYAACNPWDVNCLTRQGMTHSQSDDPATIQRDPRVNTYSGDKATRPSYSNEDTCPTPNAPAPYSACRSSGHSIEQCSGCKKYTGGNE